VSLALWPSPSLAFARLLSLTFSLAHSQTHSLPHTRALKTTRKHVETGGHWNFVWHDSQRRRLYHRCSLSHVFTTCWLIGFPSAGLRQLLAMSFLNMHYVSMSLTLHTCTRTHSCSNAHAHRDGTKRAGQVLGTHPSRRPANCGCVCVCVYIYAYKARPN